MTSFNNSSQAHDRNCLGPKVDGQRLAVEMGVRLRLGQAALPSRTVLATHGIQQDQGLPHGVVGRRSNLLRGSVEAMEVGQ